MAVPPPFGPTGSDSRDHSDRGPLFVTMSWVLTGLATLFLGLRLYCKIAYRRPLWWDDTILVGAWVMIVANDALTTVLVEDYKLGRHSWDLQIDNPVRFAILLSSRATVTITAITWTKTAFAVTLLRLTEGRVRHFVWFIIASLSITMGFSAMVPWIQCMPVEKGWDASTPGTCWAPGVGTWIFIATSVYSAVMDFTLAALPWQFLWRLRMRRKEKIGVGIAMSMGVIAGLVAIVKCAKLPNLNSPDAYEATELYMWDITESTTTMMAACIPPLRVLIRDVRENTFHFRTSTLTHITRDPVKMESLAENTTADSEASSHGLVIMLPSPDEQPGSNGAR